MNCLHLYPENDALIAQHVAILETQAQHSSQEESRSGTTLPDIVHVHSCWNRRIARQAESLRRQGARIVISPHGALQPWIIEQRQLTEKAAKTVLWQHSLVEHAYALIAHSKMEADALRQLGWNPRVETIPNAVITNTITDDEMARQTTAVYQRVLDSYTLPLLSPESVRLLAVLIKAGITGNRRWVPEADYSPATLAAIDTTQWRRLLLYADHENIREVIDSGIRALAIPPPPVDTSSIVAYLPQGYTKPGVSHTDPVSIAQQASPPVGGRKGGLNLLCLVELARALRRPDINDDNLIDELADQSLTRHFRRLLQLVAEQTLLEEGFMPLPPLDDRHTRKLRKQLQETTIIVNRK